MHPSKLVFVVLSALALGAGVGCTVSSQQEESAESDITGTDRVALMDALRSTVKPSLANQDIVFDVSKGSLRDANGWAFLMGQVQLRGGGQPTTRGTAYEDFDREGLFDGFRIEALLKKDGGRWTVVEHGLGTTDVWYDSIQDRYPAAPRQIFPWLDGPASEQVAPSERMAIMNGLRATVKPELANQDIVFNVSKGTFKSARDWCWLQGNIELRGGGQPTTHGTAYEEYDREGLFDGFRIEALLKKDGNSWKVVAHGIGSTDVWYEGIANTYPDAPKEIFPDIAR